MALRAALNNQVRNMLIPFCWVSMFHNIKFSHSGASGSNTVDGFHVWPKQMDLQQRAIPPQFNTVLVCGKQENIHGVNGICYPIEPSSG